MLGHATPRPLRGRYGERDAGGAGARRDRQARRRGAPDARRPGAGRDRPPSVATAHRRRAALPRASAPALAGGGSGCRAPPRSGPIAGPGERATARGSDRTRRAAGPDGPRGLARRCELRLRELELPAALRRPRVLRGPPAARPADPARPLPRASGRTGLWVATPAADVVFYEPETSPLHQEHIILREPATCSSGTRRSGRRRGRRRGRRACCPPAARRRAAHAAPGGVPHGGGPRGPPAGLHDPRGGLPPAARDGARVGPADELPVLRLESALDATPAGPADPVGPAAAHGPPRASPTPWPGWPGRRSLRAPALVHRRRDGVGGPSGRRSWRWRWP